MVENNKDLATKLNINSAKMGKGENISMDVLEQIYNYVDCDIGDVIGFEKIGREEVPGNGSK